MSLPFRRLWSRVQRLSSWRYGTLLLLGLGVVWLLSVLSVTPVSAQAVTQARVTEILDGNQVFIQDRQVQVNSVAQRQQRVRTASARAELQFNTGAVARLAQNSSLTVGDCAQLRRGTVLVNGPLNGCTTSTLAGVRGTLYTLEVNEADQTIVRVFEGEVMVSPRPADQVTPDDLAPEPALPDGNEQEPTSNPKGVSGNTSSFPGNGLPKYGKLAMAAKQLDGQAASGDGATTAAPAPSEEAEKVPLSADAPVAVSEGKQITITPGEPEGEVKELSLEDFQNLLQGPLLSNFTNELPGFSELQRSFEQLFPGIPFPISLPSIPIPSLPIPFPF